MKQSRFPLYVPVNTPPSRSAERPCNAPMAAQGAVIVSSRGTLGLFIVVLFFLSECHINIQHFASIPS